jgi:hypothetical protein
MEKLTDPLTKQLFVPKRRNQRFANRQNQIAYNNMIARKDRMAIKAIDTILKRNRKILKNLLGQRLEFVVRKERLLSLGYNFIFHTHRMMVNENDKKYADCVYEYVLARIINDNFKITRYVRPL